MRIIKRNSEGITFFSFHVGNICYGLEQVYEEWITTEWVVFFWIPLVPVASWNVYDTTDRWAFTAIPERLDHEMERRSGIHWPQVIRGYSITGFIVLALFALPYLLGWSTRK